jgi:hypothetical protein
MADWKTGIDGDLTLAQGGIDTTIDEAETAKQNILFRLQTGLFDYDPEPELGAGLDEFIGRPNRSDVGEAAKRAVINSLIRDAAFPLNSISVEVVPLDKHVLGIYVFHQPRFTGVGSAVTVAVTFDLTVGLVTLLDGETL